MNIEWVGNPVTGEYLKIVEKEITELERTGLSRPSDLIFHDVWLSGDFGSEDQCGVIVWGKEGCDYYFAEAYSGIDMVVL